MDSRFNLHELEPLWRTLHGILEILGFWRIQVVHLVLPFAYFPVSIFPMFSCSQIPNSSVSIPFAAVCTRFPRPILHLFGPIRQNPSTSHIPPRLRRILNCPSSNPLDHRPNNQSIQTIPQGKSTRRTIHDSTFVPSTNLSAPLTLDDVCPYAFSRIVRRRRTNGSQFQGTDLDRCKGDVRPVVRLRTQVELVKIRFSH